MSGISSGADKARNLSRDRLEIQRDSFSLFFSLTTCTADVRITYVPRRDGK